MPSGIYGASLWMKNWRQILDKIGGVKILVVGDIMLDRYLWGNVSRISPEAPVPIVKLEKVTQIPGGAANVAANVASLGATPLLVGAIGDDSAGRALPELLRANKIAGDFLVKISDRPTTTKTRVVAHQQQVVRIDDETARPLDAAESSLIVNQAVELIPESDVVVFSDYAKGCLSDAVLSPIIETARRENKAILVDPKGRDYRKYDGASLLTPNKTEAATASGLEIYDDETLDAAGEKLLADLSVETLLVTLGEDGMRLFERNSTKKHFSSAARAVYDVTGAGDTVIAALAVCLGAGADLAFAANIANLAGGLAVEQVGTTAVRSSDLIKILENADGDESVA
jgi:rfaE bifunctional protein kinase chain/domain